MDIQERRKILKNVISVLLSHKNDIRKIPMEKNNPYCLVSLKKGDNSKQNLKKVLVFGMQWRGGPRLNLSKINKVLKDFDKIYDKITKEILPQFAGQRSTDEIYKEIDKIKYIGPKITGVFLRDIVYWLGIWKELLPYLYLPVDRHIHDLLVDYLQVFSNKEVPGTSESFFTNKNQKFQKELAGIHTPRVDFDDLWFIGANFHSFRKLCPLCWIRDFCKNRFENYTDLNL